MQEQQVYLQRVTPALNPVRTHVSAIPDFLRISMRIKMFFNPLRKEFLKDLRSRHFTKSRAAQKQDFFFWTSKAHLESSAELKLTQLNMQRSMEPWMFPKKTRL